MLETYKNTISTPYDYIAFNILVNIGWWSRSKFILLCVIYLIALTDGDFNDLNDPKYACCRKRFYFRGLHRAEYQFGRRDLQ